MSCKNCGPPLYPGKLIKATKDLKHCIECGRKLNMNEDWHGEKQKRWDKYFHNICVAISSKSPCLSRQIGAILVRDKSIISTGYNGPARGYPHCAHDSNKSSKGNICPRKAKGYQSGEALHLCPAAHAEGNTVANAARNGVSTIGTTLYMNCIIPCKDCAILLVNAGIVEVVVDDITPYHEMSVGILNKGGIKVRRFNL